MLIADRWIVTRGFVDRWVDTGKKYLSLKIFEFTTIDRKSYTIILLPNTVIPNELYL